ncbi:MAG: hypothetical protein KDH94_06195 [Coxiellaceae bacterium]|nr:hypothetical protein [Coxiellaceae bacterium]
MKFAKLALFLIFLFCAFAGYSFITNGFPFFVDSKTSLVVAHMYGISYLFQALVCLIAIGAPVKTMRLLLLALFLFHGGLIVYFVHFGDLTPEIHAQLNASVIGHGAVAFLAILGALLVRNPKK